MNECQKSVSMLTSKLSLMHFKLDLEIIVALYTSEYSIGAVICQKFKDCKINAVEKYSQIGKEALFLPRKNIHK